MEQASNNSGAFVTYTALKERYEHLLNRCNNLLGEDLSEEEELRDVENLAVTSTCLALKL